VTLNAKQSAGRKVLERFSLSRILLPFFFKHPPCHRCAASSWPLGVPHLHSCCCYGGCPPTPCRAGVRQRIFGTHCNCNNPFFSSLHWLWPVLGEEPCSCSHCLMCWCLCQCSDTCVCCAVPFGCCWWTAEYDGQACSQAGDREGMLINECSLVRVITTTECSLSSS
jgi:hypothetical protein